MNLNVNAGVLLRTTAYVCFVLVLPQPRADEKTSALTNGSRYGMQ